MATNTLIQKLFASDETGVGEDSSLVSNRQQIEKFRCSEAITAGATVSLDLSQTSNGLRGLVVAEADSADCVAVGIYTGGEDALDAASGDFIDVIIKGIVEEALVDGATSEVDIGDALIISTAGTLVNQRINEGGAADFNQRPAVAIAMEAVSADGGTARVYVISNF